MTLFFTNLEQIFSSCQCRDDELLAKPACGGNGGAAESCQVVAVAARDFFDEAKKAQALEVPADAGGGKLRQKRLQVGAAHAGDIETRRLQSAQQGVFGLVEEVASLDAMAIDIF